jgi:hypothetical protein
MNFFKRIIKNPQTPQHNSTYSRRTLDKEMSNQMTQYRVGQVEKTAPVSMPSSTNYST